MTATDARSHCDRTTIASVVRNGAPAGDIARWNPTCRADWRERHLGDIYAGSVGREARSDVQIRCSIDGTRYLLLSHVLRHSDTRTGDRTSGHVGSRPLSVCNTSVRTLCLWCTGTIHSADAAAPQRAADALARHGVRVRSRLGRRDVRDVLARRGTVHHPRVHTMQMRILH